MPEKTLAKHRKYPLTLHVMTYADHLRRAILALKEARPELSDRQISKAALLNDGWVSEFLSRDAANFSKANQLLRAIGELAPPGRAGDVVRAAVVVGVEQAGSDIQEDAA